MRREHIILDSGIQPVFYVPLTTDNVDIVSGQGPISTSNVSTHNSNGVSLSNGWLAYSSSLFSWMNYNTSFTILADFRGSNFSSGWRKVCTFSSTTSPYYEVGLSVSKDSGNVKYGSMRYDHDGVADLNNVVGSTTSSNVMYNKCGLVYDGNTHLFRLIENGLISQNTSYTVYGVRNDCDFYIGKSTGSGAYWYGYIRNVMIFNKALTEQEIQEL